MKKMIPLILALLLLATALPAAAEAFTLRNGVQFGDTIEQIREK